MSNNVKKLNRILCNYKDSSIRQKRNLHDFIVITTDQ